MKTPSCCSRCSPAWGRRSKRRRKVRERRVKKKRKSRRKDQNLNVSTPVCRKSSDVFDTVLTDLEFVCLLISFALVFFTLMANILKEFVRLRHHVLSKCVCFQLAQWKWKSVWAGRIKVAIEGKDAAGERDAPEPSRSSVMMTLRTSRKRCVCVCLGKAGF